MKISYRWLLDFLDTTATPQELSQMLTGCGLEVEDLSPWHSIPGGLEGVVIGNVQSVVKHPNADKLRVCQVDLGGGTVKQIVCGAPNVAEGQKVLVATVGTTVHPSKGEPFTIQKAKIRGEVSEGMICAEDELSLGESHDGILVLPSDYETGKPAADYFPVYSDYLLEIGLTANRGDAASHYGVARDLIALGIPARKPELPSLPNKPNGGIEVHIEEGSGCLRYSGLMLKGVQVKPSPAWLQNRLRCIGLSPINNIVDATNYILHTWGQPLHAFDAKQIASNKVIVRTAREGEKVVLLDGQERTLKGFECLITDPDKVLALAGVFGGQHSGIQSDTTEIFLESAWFDSATVRKAAKAHGLNTDASFRFERGTDPHFTMKALHYAAALMIDIAGGEVEYAATDVFPNPPVEKHILFSPSRSNQLIGMEISFAEQKEILERLEIKVEESADHWNLTVPAYRVDVTRPADVTEEILRIYGLNKIPMGTSIKSAMTFSDDEFSLTTRSRIADYLSDRGFFEIMTNSLTRSASQKHAAPESHIGLLNPLSQELDVMRPDMLHSMLEAAQYNVNRKNLDLQLFELGKIYAHNPEQKGLTSYQEQRRLVIGLTGKKEPEGWNNTKTESGYFTLKGILEQLMNLCGITKYQMVSEDHAAFGLCTKLMVNKKEAGRFGQINTKLASEYDLSKPFWYADIDLDMITQAASTGKFRMQPVSVFPAVRRDLALVLDEPVTYAQLEQIALKTAPGVIAKMGVFDVYRGDKIPAGKKSYAVSFVLQDTTKTLTDVEIDAVMSKLVNKFSEQAGATLRS